MVRLVAIFFACLILPNFVQAKVSVSPKKIMLGLPITMIFLGKDIETDFEKVDKEALKKQFEIYDIDGDSDRIRLVLYPKVTGKLTLPSMKQGKIDFKGEVITVTENDEVAIDWKRPVIASVEDSSQPIFVNQMVTWQAVVSLSNKANKATFEQHPHYNNQLSYQLSSEPYQTETGLLSDREYFSMSVTLDKAGNTKIRTPVVRVKNTSTRAWLFFDQTAYLQVNPLASYLPVNTAVGKLAISLSDLPLFANTGELVNLKWQVVGKNVPVHLLPNLSQQLGFQAGIEWLLIDNRHQQLIANTGIENRLEVIQPFRANAAGFYKVPSLRATYFDVESQQLRDVFTAEKTILVAPPWVVWVLNLLAYSLLLVLIVFTILIFVQTLAKKLLITRLKKAKNVEEVWLACHQWSSQLFLRSANISVGQWQQLVQNQFASSEPLTTLIEALNQKNYSKIDAKVHKIAIIWANSLPWFHLNLLIVLLVKWQNDLTVFIKGNR